MIYPLHRAPTKNDKKTQKYMQAHNSLHFPFSRVNKINECEEMANEQTEMTKRQAKITFEREEIINEHGEMTKQQLEMLNEFEEMTEQQSEIIYEQTKMTK